MTRSARPRVASRRSHPKAAAHALGLPSPSAGLRRVELTATRARRAPLVIAGYANKQIARKLGISEKTVKGHLTNLFQRIGVADRTQAALWAEREGIFRS